jgi:hypothetical protein
LKKPYTVFLGNSFDGGDVFIDARPYEPGHKTPFLAEIEMRSGHSSNDGLVMAETLSRLTREQVTALRDRLNGLLEPRAEHLS